MNKWFKLALNSFIGLILLNLLLSILYGGGIGFNLNSLLIFSFKLLYVVMVVGIIAGVAKLIKDAWVSKD